MQFKQSFLKLLCFAAILVTATLSHAQSVRVVKKQVQPLYPSLARQTHVEGSVRLEVVIGANGQVRSVKPIGGHPLLINAAQDAVKRWVFEPAGGESTQEIVVKFTNNGT